MKFEVELTERADKDLRNIFLYIAVDLSALKYKKTNQSFVVRDISEQLKKI